MERTTYALKVYQNHGMGYGLIKNETPKHL